MSLFDVDNYVTKGDYIMINREGNYDDGEMRQCTSCRKMFNKTSKTVTLCNPCNSERVKSRPITKKVWQRAKGRAKQKGIEFNIELCDIVIPQFCPILGIELKENKGKPGAYRDSISIDKIDPTKGYVKGNIQIISQLANGMKQNASPDELIKFAEYILLTYKPDME